MSEPNGSVPAGGSSVGVVAPLPQYRSLHHLRRLGVEFLSSLVPVRRTGELLVSRELVRQTVGQLASMERVPRPLVRQLDTVHRQAVVSVARVNAAAYVAHTALGFTAQLSAEESRLIQACPLGEPRYKAIIDHFTGVACAEIAGWGW